MGNNNLRSLFNWKRLLKFFAQYVVTVLMIAAIALFTITTIMHIAWSRYEKAITTSPEFRNISLTNLCLVLQCEIVVVKMPDGSKLYLKREGNVLVKHNNFDHKAYNTVFYNITLNKRLVLGGEGYMLYINSDLFYTIFYNTFYFVLIVTTLPYTLTSIYFYIKRRKREILANRELKNNMELSLQRNITEMIHHELNAPIALLTTQVDELYIHEFGIGHEVNYEPITEKEKEIYPLYEDIYFSIERVNSVLNTLSRTKHIKFNNGTVPLLLIIKNMESSINAFKLEKIKVQVKNKDLLQKYSVVKKLGNGSIMNILHILFTNAIEAYSTTIDISCELTGKNNMVIFIKDNGSGIKDEKGNYVKDDRIFKNGYSSKLDILPKKGFFNKLFKVDEQYDFTGERGIGLFIVKNLLTSNGGDIKLEDTGPDGATFKLTIPVKETIYRH